MATQDVSARLVDLQQRPWGFEVLVDAGAYTLGEGERWCQVKRVRPQARFPVLVECGTYRYGEIRGIREVRRGDQA